MIRILVPTLILIFAMAAPAAARDDCILDHCADQQGGAPAAPGAPQPRRPAPSALPSGDFDFYVLALSWSPGFCQASGGGRAQCEPGLKRGFVVHGLWPQYEHGFPSNCGGVPTPSRLALDRAKDLYPDESLARYEWRKHGTCSGRSPGDYFDDVARARDGVAVPPALARLEQDRTLATLDIERAFYEANPRLRPGMMSVECARGVLEEARICMSKDLREFRACPEVARRGCRVREISVPAPY